MKCPNCGLDLDDYDLVPRPAWTIAPAAPGRPVEALDWHALSSMPDSNRPPWAGDVAPMSGMGMGIPQFSEATQRRPARPADPGSDVVVPLLQSVVSATVAAILGLLLAAVGQIDAPLVIGVAGAVAAVAALRIFAGTIDKIVAVVVICLVCGLAMNSVPGAVEVPWFFPLVAFVVVLVGVWVWRLWAHSQLLWVHQHIVNRQPEPAAAPAPAAETFMLEVTSGKTIKRFDLPGKPRQFCSLAQTLLDGAPFTEDEFTPSGRLYSVPTFRKIVARFVELGYAEWKNPLWHRGGLALTDDGIAFLETWVRDYRQGQHTV